MPGVDAVSGPGEVEMIPQVVGAEAVIGAVFKSSERDRRPELVPFAGVVIDDVEDDLDAGLMEALHHFLEFSDFLAVVPAGESRVRSKETEGVVPPVIGEAPFEQEDLIHPGWNWQQLGCGSSQA